MKSLFIVLVILMLGTVACTSNDDAVNALQQEIDALKEEMVTASELQECLIRLFEQSIDGQPVAIGTTGLYVNTNAPYVLDFDARSTEEEITLYNLYDDLQAGEITNARYMLHDAFHQHQLQFVNHPKHSTGSSEKKFPSECKS